MTLDELKALCRRSDNDVVNAGEVWRLRQALLAAIREAERQKARERQSKERAEFSETYLVGCAVSAAAVLICTVQAANPEELVQKVRRLDLGAT